MLHNRRKGGIGALLVAGAAAFAYYKYSKMSEAEKRNLMGNIKQKGRKFYDENIPQNVKDMLGKKKGATNGTANTFS